MQGVDHAHHTCMMYEESGPPLDNTKCFNKKHIVRRYHLLPDCIVDDVTEESI